MTTSLIPATERPFDDIDVSSLYFWGLPPKLRDESFAKLRAKGGVTWHPPVEAQPLPPQDPGFWAVTKNSLVVEVSRDQDRFSAEPVTIYDVPLDFRIATTGFMYMDQPQHTRYRRLVSKAFTPKQLQRIDNLVSRQSTLAVDALEDAGPCNFVEVVSNYLPSMVITDMVGIDDEESRQELVGIVTRLLAFGDPALRHGVSIAEFFATLYFEMHQAAEKFVAKRRSQPNEGLITALIESESDGDRLTDAEISSFFCALIIAGIDTTRNALTFGLQALTEFPDQRQLLLEDLPGRMDSAVLEMARWASPVGTFVRRAKVDTELAGVPIAAGDRVAMLYLSANRDESVFEDPWQFDITRDNSHQLAWGGGGPHYCLGANLAKVEIKSLWLELLKRIPTVRATGEPVYASSPLVTSVEQQMCEWD